MKNLLKEGPCRIRRLDFRILMTSGENDGKIDMLGSNAHAT